MIDIANAEREMRDGIELCVQTFGPDVVMAVDPETVCMVGGPGTDFCLMGRCFEIVNWQAEEGGLPHQYKDRMVSTAYSPGSDMRTEVCQRMLTEYQRRQLTTA